MAAGLLQQPNRQFPKWSAEPNLGAGAKLGVVCRARRQLVLGNSTMSPGLKPGERVIYRRFITTKDGRRLDAHAYGKRVFRSWG